VLVVVLLALSVSLLWFSQQPAASSSSQQGWKKVSLVTRLTALTATRTYIASQWEISSHPPPR
jgi:hypothetical protein